MDKEYLKILTRGGDMKIIYTSTLCEKKYIQSKLGANPAIFGHPVQKYHKLLTDGLAMQENVEVETISAPPITPNNCKFKYIKSETVERGIKYNHLSVVNLPKVKNICTTLSSFLKMLCITKPDVMMSDILNVSVCLGTLIACKLRRIPTIGIVTDLPDFLSTNQNIGTQINNKIMRSFDSYLLLTEDMYDVVNKDRNKPYVVIEGQVDIHMNTVDNLLQDKADKKICIYAGSLKKIYGISYLSEAFIKADIPNSELHIYGDGDYKEELLKICKIHHCIKYMGVQPNDLVVQEELKASLLINPRPTNEEYTKYSFPSKNMEYMVSGTPILTTKLSGMPKEYYEYVYFIEDETVEGLRETLVELLNKSQEELHDFGQKAKRFVLEKKNNKVQARKIIDMVDKACN